MAQNDLVQPIEAAATSQVKLSLCDEEDSHICFRLIEAQFTAAGIRSQRLKYANNLASLPKQVLWDILDTVDVCNDSDQPFDHLKEVLLRQFGKSKWQSYFDLLCLPMEMQGSSLALSWGNSYSISLQASVWTQISFWQFFYTPTVFHEGGGQRRKPQDGRSCCESSGRLVGRSRRPRPTVAATMTQRSQSPTQANMKKSDKRSVNNGSKSSPPSPPDFYSFHNPGNGVCKFHNYYTHKALRCISPCTWSEN
jgi:hypothetical protein